MLKLKNNKSLQITLVLLLFSISVSGWAMLAYWALKADPWQRQRLAVSLRSAVGEKANVVLVGDSILKTIASPCSNFINISIPGARILDVPEKTTRLIGNLQPKSIVVLMGINDLRLGDGIDAVADRTATLAAKMRNSVPSAQIIVLSILPIIENDIAWSATNSSIESARQAIRSRLAETDIEFADITGLFGYNRLEASFTEDGLHLNAAGTARLAALIRGFVSMSGASPCP